MNGLTIAVVERTAFCGGTPFPALSVADIKSSIISSTMTRRFTISTSRSRENENSCLCDCSNLNKEKLMRGFNN